MEFCQSRKVGTLITIEPIDVCVWIGVWQCERTISRDHQCLCAKKPPRSKFDPTQQILTPVFRTRCALPLPPNRYNV